VKGDGGGVDSPQAAQGVGSRSHVRLQQTRCSWQQQDSCSLQLNAAPASTMRVIRYQMLQLLAQSPKSSHVVG
jgi:hypothetical protein